jgi:hypothetical protein
MESKSKASLIKEKNIRKLSALIIGGSGASGRELIDNILQNINYESITVLSRRKISRWENLNEDKLKKFIYISIENLDDLLDFEKNPEGYKKILPEKNYDTLFCCLGSRSGRSDFIKVDYDYFISCAKIAEILNIQHLVIISSKGADSSSYFKYFRIKGQADNEIMKVKIPCISILRPGAIMDRDNDYRFGEKLLKYTPFLSKITSIDLGTAIMNIDLDIHFNLNSNNQVKIFDHNEIVGFINKMI